MKKLSIVIPCYQSEQDFENLITELTALLPKMEALIKVEFILVDDGSTDKTFNCMVQFKNEFSNTKLIKLTGNFGAHAAFLAGLSSSNGDCSAVLQPDLQDPPEHLLAMINYWLNGWALVIGQRIKREDGFTQKGFSSIYHSFVKHFGLNHIPKGGYDLILFDKSIRDQVVLLSEPNVSLIYLISSFKHPYVTVPITRVINKKGTSSWTFYKKIKLFIDSMVAFSYFPIQFISILALLIGFSFVCLSVWGVVMVFQKQTISLLFKLVYILTFFSFLISVMLSIIGEYLWRTLELARKRPSFVIDKIFE